MNLRIDVCASVVCTFVRAAALFVAAAAPVLPAMVRAQEPPPAYRSNPEFLKVEAQAKMLARHPADLRFAGDAWRKANHLAGGACMECFEGMIQTSIALGEPKDTAKYALQMEAAATTAAQQSTAETYLGHAYLTQSGREKPRPALLEQAHAALTKAVEHDSRNATPLYLDGMVLALLNRDSEAAAAFRNFAAHARPGDPLRVRAEHMAANPEMAHQKMAPSFAVTTLAGKQFNLDDMGGRVVLIDFWATWCGPCNQELPHLQKLAAKYAGEPFEIVSISWDSDEAKWKSFIAEHGMAWNQYRDANHHLSEMFGISSIPHYFTIDSDGVLTAENVGSGSMTDSRIDKLVKRAREAMNRTTETAAAKAGQ